jgi:hypothetical protein
MCIKSRQTFRETSLQTMGPIPPLHTLEARWCDLRDPKEVELVMSTTAPPSKYIVTTDTQTHRPQTHRPTDHIRGQGEPGLDWSPA